MGGEALWAPAVNGCVCAKRISVVPQVKCWYGDTGGHWELGGRRTGEWRMVHAGLWRGTNYRFCASGVIIIAMVLNFDRWGQTPVIYAARCLYVASPGG